MHPSVLLLILVLATPLLAAPKPGRPVAARLLWSAPRTASTRPGKPVLWATRGQVAILGADHVLRVRSLSTGAVTARRDLSTWRGGGSLRVRRPSWSKQWLVLRTEFRSSPKPYRGEKHLEVVALSPEDLQEVRRWAGLRPDDRDLQDSAAPAPAPTKSGILPVGREIWRLDDSGVAHLAWRGSMGSRVVPETAGGTRFVDGTDSAEYLHALQEHHRDRRLGHDAPFETAFVAAANTRFEFADGVTRTVPLEFPGHVWIGVLEDGDSLGAYKDGLLALLDRQTRRWRTLVLPEAASITSDPWPTPPHSAAGPGGQVFISGYAHADHPGHTAVWDTWSGTPVAWIPLAPGRTEDGLGRWSPPTRDPVPLARDRLWMRERRAIRVGSNFELGLPITALEAERLATLERAHGPDWIVAELPPSLGWEAWTVALRPRVIRTWRLPTGPHAVGVLVQAPDASLTAWAVEAPAKRNMAPSPLSGWLDTP